MGALCFAPHNTAPPYPLLPTQVILQLAATPTDAGYNDGISGSAGSAPAQGLGLTANRAAPRAGEDALRPVTLDKLDALLRVPGPARDLLLAETDAKVKGRGPSTP